MEKFSEKRGKKKREHPRLRIAWLPNKPQNLVEIEICRDNPTIEKIESPPLFSARLHPRVYLNVQRTAGVEVCGRGLRGAVDRPRGLEMAEVARGRVWPTRLLIDDRSRGGGWEGEGGKGARICCGQMGNGTVGARRQNLFRFCFHWSINRSVARHAQHAIFYIPWKKKKKNKQTVIFPMTCSRTLSKDSFTTTSMRNSIV